MELVGVADVTHDYRIRVAAERGYPMFASTTEARPMMEAEYVPMAGVLDDLLSTVEW